jgi:hypothetical protein
MESKRSAPYEFEETVTAVGQALEAEYQMTSV